MKILGKGLSYTTLICSTLLTPVVSQAAEFTYEKHSSGKHFMVMQGRTEQNDHLKFEKFIQNAPEQTSKVIFLNSNGGSLEAALHIAMTISNYKINTVVMGDCLSACSVIFASGSKKHIPYTDVGFGEGGNRVGVHTPYITINGENYSQQVGSGSWWQIYGILRGSGMSHQQVKDFLHYTYTTPHENTTKKHGRFTCVWCRKEGNKVDGQVCTYRKSISWRKEPCSCEEHRELAIKMIERQTWSDNREYTEADYQTWLRL